jgi:uncharacterized protein with HEPN domain
MTPPDPISRVRHMLDYARDAVEMVRGRSREDLHTDRHLNMPLVRLMEEIGEAANRVPDDFRSRHPQVPWREAVGMRNRIIYGYNAIDLDILWSVLRTDLPPLITALEKILTEEE